MQLYDPTETTAREPCGRNNCFGADLHIFPEPDEPRLDCTGGLTSEPAIERRRKRDLDQRDKLVKRGGETDVFHVVLEVFEAVLEREAIVDKVGIGQSGALGLRGETEVQSAGNCKRPQPGQGVRQIPHAFAKIDDRGQRREVQGAEGLDPARMSEIRIDADQRDGLMRSVQEELIVELGAEATKSG